MKIQAQKIGALQLSLPPPPKKLNGDIIGTVVTILIRF
jgi:hypothetical protein